jgi:spermidine/putrescine transport system ATP-binding protein
MTTVDQYPAVLRNVTKRYGSETAVDSLSLEIGAGEFLSLLGPSGCGKTTTLRMIAGFVVPDEGQILLDGQDVVRVPPYRRNVNTVFQSYALFEHLTVAENVAFGLRRRKVDKKEITRRVGEMIDLVQLGGRGSAKPAQLSGGQQQRVALARALVNRPAVLLLDEPLGALDLKLRREMQVELKALQREVGITFVFVTHDQEEALTMSDRIGVMNGGRLQQLGTALEIYNRPANSFVASFIGTSNLMAATIDGHSVRIADRISAPLEAHQLNGLGSGRRDATICVRPEKLVIGAVRPEGSVGISAQVVDVVYLGPTTNVLLDVGDGVRLVALVVSTNGDDAVTAARGDHVEVSWRPGDMLVFSG